MARLFVSLLTSLIILFPLSFAPVDDRGLSISPIVIHLQKNSPAYAAFEDILDNYSVSDEPHQSIQLASLTSGTKFSPVKYSHPIENVKTPEVIIGLKPIRIEAPRLAANIVTDLPIYDDRGELLPLSTRKEQILSALSANDFKAESPIERAKQLVEEALQDYNPGERKIVTSTGGNIVVSKGPSPQQDNTPTNNPDVHNSGFHIQGSVEIRGVDYRGPEESKWSFYRTYNDQMMEQGTVDPMQGAFNIKVSDQRGFLVAELKDKSGRIKGTGKTALGSSKNYTVHIHPTDTSTVAAFVEGGSKASPSPTIKAFGDPMQRFGGANPMDLAQFTKQSRFFVEAFTDGTHATVTHSLKEGLNNIRLFSKKTISAFFSIVSSFSPDAGNPKWATIWGRVLQNGKPIDGAVVEVAGTGEVSYFNELLIPNGKLRKTTSSGEFAVLKVQPGVQAIRVEHNGRIYPARILPTFASRFTHVDMEIPSQFKKQIFNIFDIIDHSKKIEASLRVMGLDDLHNLSGQGEIELPVLNEGFSVEVDAGNGYEIVRAHLPSISEEAQISIPMFSESWLSELIAKSGESMDRSLGISIGFVGDNDSEVSLLNNAHDLARTVYFDRNLQRVDSKHAPAGGGYVQFNIPLGFQTVKIQPIHSSQSHVESFVSEPYFLYLVGSQGLVYAGGQEDL